MEYILIREEGLSSLQEKVNKLLCKGYKLQGGAWMSYVGSITSCDIYYIQAMYKD